MAHMCNLTGTNIAITHSCVEKTQMLAHLINYLPASRHLWSDHTHKLEVAIINGQRIQINLRK